jgi:hypothetical protein
MKRNEILTKTERVTAYGFACGYVETKKAKKGTDYVKLWKDSFVYSVTGFVNNVRVWESFDKLNEARKFYNSIKF